MFDLVVNVLRDANAAGLRQFFQPRGKVDAMSVDILVVGHDVGQVDAHAKLHAAVPADVDVASGYLGLDLDRGLYRSPRARKLGEKAVARELDDAALLFGDDGIDELLTMGPPGGHGGLLVCIHEARVARYVGSEDCGEFTFEPGRFHGNRPPHREIRHRQCMRYWRRGPKGRTW